MDVLARKGCGSEVGGSGNGQESLGVMDMWQERIHRIAGTEPEMASAQQEPRAASARAGRPRQRNRAARMPHSLLRLPRRRPPQAADASLNVCVVEGAWVLPLREGNQDGNDS